jgi:hypothetical protein
VIAGRITVVIDPSKTSGSIAPSDAGLAIAAGTSPELVVPWPEILSASVAAYDLVVEVQRVVTFDHESGEYFEISEAADGWESAIARLGDHMDLLVESPLRLARGMRPEDEPFEIARRRDG